MNSLDYAKLACDTMIKTFDANKLPPVGRFHYHQGVFLLGMQRCYNECKDERYYEYIKEWVDSIIYPDGSINMFYETEMDDIMPAILLFDLFLRTGDMRYKIALDKLIPLYKKWPENDEGGFFHKYHTENQMWLDGLYMAGPLSTRYAKVFGDDCYYDMFYKQAMLMKLHTKNEKTGLYFHGWDASKKKEWADEATGASSEHWGRAIGWYVVALCDMLDYMPKDYEHRGELISTLGDLIDALIRYQDEKSGMWYQVVDKGDVSGNWLEGSCSSLFVYSIAKAVRKGYVRADLADRAMKGYEGVVGALKFDKNGGMIIDNVCVGTGIGDYAHYINRPTSINDLHGMGAFVLMCMEITYLSK